VREANHDDKPEDLESIERKTTMDRFKKDRAIKYDFLPAVKKGLQGGSGTLGGEETARR